MNFDANRPFGPVMSEAEARFERIRRAAGLVLAPVLFLTTLAIPMESLQPGQHRLLAVLVLIVTLWMTEALPLALTGVLAPVMMILLGVVPAAQAFAPYADPIMFLFIGAFVLARGIQIHGLDRRFAYAVLKHPIVGSSPSRIMFAYGLVCLVISMWISNTAAVAMMFPIGLAIIAMLGGAKASVNLNEILRRRLTVSGSTLRPRPVSFKGAIARSLRDKVWPHIESGAIKPVIYRIFPLAEAAHAHLLMESSEHIGKIVLSVG